MERRAERGRVPQMPEHARHVVARRPLFVKAAVGPGELDVDVKPQQIRNELPTRELVRRKEHRVRVARCGAAAGGVVRWDQRREDLDVLGAEVGVGQVGVGAEERHHEREQVVEVRHGEGLEHRRVVMQHVGEDVPDVLQDVLGQGTEERRGLGGQRSGRAEVVPDEPQQPHGDEARVPQQRIVELGVVQSRPVAVDGAEHPIDVPR